MKIKHNIKITIILLSMFLLAQLIGLLVINSYSPQNSIVLNQTTGVYENVSVPVDVPYGFQPPEMEPTFSLLNIVFSFVLAILLIFLLMKIKAQLFLRLWFFFVVVIALSITINAIFLHFTVYSSWIALVIALPLAIYKIFRRNLIVHNVTELMIYPGLAAVFVPILSVWTVIIFLILISLYDAWAVWHSGVMQKMAKYQMNQLKIFAGFFLPYLGKKERAQIQLIKQKYKNKAIPKSAAKIKVSMAILGGGDVVFPIITSGIFLRAFGIIPALFVMFGAFFGLAFLLMISVKKKFYPAMPFITAGIFLGMLLSWLITIF